MPNHKLSYHVEKYKKDAIKGLQIHNQRQRKSRSNPDIDPQRKSLNYDLHNASQIDATEAVQRRIDELLLVKAIRKDAVYMCESVVSSGREFFSNMPLAEQQRFFQESYNFLADFCGKENIVYAIVHMDETTPHMHFSHVPVTQDGRLCAKDIYNRESLKALQTNLHLHLQEKGFAIERGEENSKGLKKKHLNTAEFKVKQEEVKKLRQDADIVSASLQNLQREHQAMASEARAALAGDSNLPALGALNAKAVHKAASQIIELQKKAILDRDVLARRNIELEQHITQLNHEQKKSQQEIKQQHEKLVELRGRHSRLENEADDLREFIGKPDISRLFTDFMQHKREAAERMKEKWKLRREEAQARREAQAKAQEQVRQQAQEEQARQQQQLEEQRRAEARAREAQRRQQGKGLGR